MTDARYPERWLMDRRIQRLPDAAFRTFVTSLAWSVANRTDGVVTFADRELLPDGDPRCIGQLVDAGLWEVTGDGWLISVFEETQTTRADLDHLDRQRRLARDRKRRERERRVTRDVPRDVTHDSTRTGQDRTGT